MRKVFVNMQPYFDHKMIYGDDTKVDDKKEIGVDNNFIKESSLVLFENLKNNDIECRFEKNNKAYDNIICDRQDLKMEVVACKRIIVFGFCEWGYYRDCAVLSFSDGSNDIMHIKFGDIGWDFTGAIEYQFDMNREYLHESRNIMQKVKLKNQDGFIFYTVTEFDNVRKLNKITLPDNVFMHIMAITVEG